MVELTGAANRRVKGYSLGMRQRLALAAALLGDPRILILDEPANGLDPQGMRWLRDLLRDQAAAGRTVLVSSHLLSEVDQTADELVVIRDGKLVSQTSLAEFTAGGRPACGCGPPTPTGSRSADRRAAARSSATRGAAGRRPDGEAIGDLRWRRDRDPRAGAAALQPRGALPRGDGRGGAPRETSDEPAAQRVDEALLNPHDLGDARHRTAQRGAVRRALRGLASLNDIEEFGELHRHRADDGPGAGPRGPGDHHRVPPRDLQLHLPRLAAALAGAAGEAGGARSSGCLPAWPSSSSTAAWGCPVLTAAISTCRRPATLVDVYAGVVISFGLLCAFGFGVGAIVRNQVGAIIATIAFFFILSPLPELLPGDYRRLLPGADDGLAAGIPKTTASARSPGASSSPPGPSGCSRSAPLLI